MIFNYLSDHNMNFFCRLIFNLVLPCLLFFVITPFWNSVIAQSSSTDALIQNIIGRTTVSLDGQWGIIVDPYENGYYDYRYQPNANGYFKDQKVQNPSDLVEYNFDTGQTLNVPGDWNTQDDKLFLYEGTIWYKRAFEYSPQENERQFIYIGAANYEAHVYLNGELIGHHIGGFTPFNMEVTDKMRDGENTLVVKVDNQRKRDGVPTVNTDWWNYGGITRSVSLISVPDTFIENYFVQLDPESRNTVRGWVQMNGSEKGEREITIQIPEANIKEKVTTNSEGWAEVEFTAHLERWSPSNPKLYEVILRAEDEKVEDQIGFRTIQQKDGEILLNGEPIFLRGICIHESRPFGGGRANNPADAEVLLGWAKQLNSNYVRLAHYPHNEHMLRAADKMGILVWSEVPVYWTVQFEKPEVYQNAEHQMTEMVNRDHNRASIILWSLANETPRSDARFTFLSNLAKSVRKLDSTRLITAALETQSREEGVIGIHDPMAEVVDVIGVNSYCGWYGNMLPEECADLKWVSDVKKPVIISEFGGGALQGFHGEENERWTEEFQAAVYENNLKMMDNISFLRGTSPWILKDFRSPRRPLPRIQDFWNRKGLISDEGVRKESFYIMQDWYQKKEKEWEN